MGYLGAGGPIGTLPQYLSVRERLAQEPDFRTGYLEDAYRRWTEGEATAPTGKLTMNDLTREAFLREYGDDYTLKDVLEYEALRADAREREETELQESPEELQGRFNEAVDKERKYLLGLIPKTEAISPQRERELSSRAEANVRQRFPEFAQMEGFTKPLESTELGRAALGGAQAGAVGQAVDIRGFIRGLTPEQRIQVLDALESE
jgi:hypothetical protein